MLVVTEWGTVRYSGVLVSLEHPGIWVGYLNRRKNIKRFIYLANINYILIFIYKYFKLIQ